MAGIIEGLAGAGVSALQASQMDEPLTPEQIFSKSMNSWFGGLGLKRTRQYQKAIEARQAGTATPEQLSYITQFDDKLRLSQKSSAANKLLANTALYQPRFDQQAMDRMGLRIPQINALNTGQYAENAPLLAAGQRQAMIAGAPDYMGLQGSTTALAQQNLGQGLNDQQLQFFRNQLLGAQWQKGLMDSPLGSAQEAMYLTQLNMQQQQQNWANALTAQNQYRMPAMPGYPGMQGASMEMLDVNNAQFQAPSLSSLMGLTQTTDQQMQQHNAAKIAMYGQAIQQGAGVVDSAITGYLGGGPGGATGFKGMFGGKA